METGMSTRRAFLQSIAGSSLALGAPATLASRRPPVEKRSFTSEAVEATISRVKRSIADPEYAWLFENCFPNTLDTTVRTGRSRRQAGHLRHHRRHRRHVAARLHGAGLALPAACQGRRQTQDADRGRHQPPDPLHPDRPLRQRLQLRPDRQRVGQGPHRDEARVARAQMGDRFALLPGPAGARLLEDRRATPRVSTRNWQAGRGAHRPDVSRAAAPSRIRVRTHFQRVTAVPGDSLPQRRLRQPDAAVRPDPLRVPPLRRRLHLPVPDPLQPVRGHRARPACTRSSARS